MSLSDASLSLGMLLGFLCLPLFLELKLPLFLKLPFLHSAVKVGQLYLQAFKYVLSVAFEHDVLVLQVLAHAALVKLNGDSLASKVTPHELLNRRGRSVSLNDVKDVLLVEATTNETLYLYHFLEEVFVLLTDSVRSVALLDAMSCQVLALLDDHVVVSDV